MKKASIDNQTQRSFNEFSWKQLIINSYLVIRISATNAEEKTATYKKTFHYLSVRNRPLHALMDIIGKFTKKQSCKMYVFLYISVLISHMEMKHTHTEMKHKQRSGCHSNVPEIKTVLFKLFYLFTYYFTCFGRFACFGGLFRRFRVWVHPGKNTRHEM